MTLTTVEAMYYTGVEDRSFTARDTGQEVPFYRYTFVSDDEEGTAFNFGSRKGNLSAGIKKFDLCYPIISIQFNKDGNRITLDSIQQINDGK